MSTLRTASFLIILAALTATTASSQSTSGVPVPRRVADINRKTFASDPGQVLDMGSFVVFAADDRLAGRELWRSDGSAGGTYLLKDIFPGVGGSFPDSFVRAGAAFYFTA